MAKKSAPQPAARPQRSPPEAKFGPFPGTAGIGVAVWLNTTQTDDGPRQFRTITIAPRRYRDRETGEWKDASGFNPSDLPALIFALSKAQEYVFETSLPGQDTSTGNGATDDVPY